MFQLIADVQVRTRGLDDKLLAFNLQRKLYNETQEQKLHKTLFQPNSRVEMFEFFVCTRKVGNQSVSLARRCYNLLGGSKWCFEGFVSPRNSLIIQF